MTGWDAIYNKAVKGIMRQSDFYERGTDADKRLNPQVNNNSTVPLSPQEGA